MTIYVVLPAYNEEEALEPLAGKIHRVLTDLRLPYRIVVVDDGSRDRTPEILATLARQYPIDIITHRINRGLGETERDAFEYVAEKGSRGDVVVRMDCDDTHDPKYIPTMLAKLREGYEVVIASRYAPGGGQVGVNLYRRTISRCANMLMKSVFPIRGVWEYTSGFRAYRVSLVQDAVSIFGNRFLDLKGMGFTGTVEKIIKCRMLGARITEVGFVLRYDQKMSPSKVVTSITTLGYLVLIAKYIRFWGDIGQRWQAQIEERKRRVYGSDGSPVEAIEFIERARECAESPA